MVLDPFLVDGDVAFEEVEAWILEPFTDAVGAHVHAIDLPIGCLDNPFGQVMADEAVDAKDEDFFHR